MSDESLRAKRETLLVAILLILASTAVLYPFLDAVLFAIATAYFLGFAHKKLTKYVKNEALANTVLISGLLAAVSGGLYFFIENVYNIVTSLNQFVIELEGKTVDVLESLDIPSYIISEVTAFFQQSSNFASDQIFGVLFSLPNLVINVAIFLVASIYLYKDRKKIQSRLDKIIEDLPSTEARIIRSLVDSMDAIFKGVFMTQIIVAAILGLITGIGFYIIGLLTSPIPLIPLWMAFVAVAAILPLVAAFMFYAPLGVYYIISAEPVKGSLILLFGLTFLQIMPEVLLRPWVGSKRLEEHPLIVFIGFLAGPLVLGVKGIILGPVILILTREFILGYTDLVSEQN